MTKYKDLVGKKFNKLEVIKLAYIRNGRSYWECKCDCGNTTIVRSDSLQNGTIKACGCLKLVNCRKAKTTHGLSRTRIYKKWEGMKARCLNSNSLGYIWYGARGIKVCDEWRLDFTNFYNWAMANGYRDDLSLDRIDVNGNYEPSNCRWVTMKTQGRNRRTNHHITYNGETHCIAEWLQILGIRSRTIANKLYAGYPIEKLISDFEEKWGIKRSQLLYGAERWE